jgi:hypothetical protein
MVIDSHVHLKHGDAAHTEYSPEEIVAVMDGAGIDKSVVFAMSCTPAQAIAMAQAAVEKFPERLIPYAYGLPSYEEDVLKLVENAVTKKGFRGIKVHAGECTLGEHVSDPIFALAGELGVPCLVDCVGRHEDMERLARKFPRTRIIIAHMGVYLTTNVAILNRFIELAAQNENVALDVSGVVVNWKIKEAVARIGAGRVVFGTDGPHKTPDTISYAQAELDKIRTLRLAPADEEAVLGGSIAGILGFKG